MRNFDAKLTRLENLASRFRGIGHHHRAELRRRSDFIRRNNEFIRGHNEFIRKLDVKLNRLEKLIERNARRSPNGRRQG